jgi:hypothetical protein
MDPIQPFYQGFFKANQFSHFALLRFDRKNCLNRLLSPPRISCLANSLSYSQTRYGNRCTWKEILLITFCLLESSYQRQCDMLWSCGGLWGHVLEVFHHSRSSSIFGQYSLHKAIAVGIQTSEYVSDPRLHWSSQD